MAIIGKRLKQARENAKFTQMKAAKKLGVSNGTLSGYERNYRDPDTDIIDKMANLYGVSVEWLMGRTDDPTTISKIEEILDKHKNKTPGELKELAAIYKVNYEDLLIKSGYIEDSPSNKSLTKEEKDVAKRLEEFKEEIENSDGLAFSGEPLSDEAKESLIESMKFIFEQTQRINKKYTPKKYRDDSDK